MKIIFALIFRISLILYLSATAAMAQTKPKESYSLHGQLFYSLKGKAYLLNPNKEAIDSTQITGNRFIFKGRLSEPDLYFIRLDTNERIYDVFMENAVMKINFSKDGKHSVDGSKLHKQLEAYETAFINPVREELIRLFEERSKALKAGDSLLFNRLMKQNDSVSIYFGTRNKDYISQKPYTLFNLFLLKTSSTGDEYEYKANMLTEFKKDLGTYPTFHRLEQSIKEINLQRVKVSAGKPAYVFTLPDSTGILHSLTSRKKKIILLDFWASWCGPCIVQLPLLKELNATYSAQGLNIIGISIDDDRNRWLQA